MDSFDGFRERFRVPPGIYLLNHSAGALPVAAQAKQERFFASWQSRGGDAWNEWLGQVDEFRGALAQLLGGRPEEFCPQAGVTGGIVKLLHGVNPRPGRGKILCSALDFPSVGFALQQLERRGWQLVMMEPDAQGFFPLEQWQRSLTEEIDWALITHSLYGNSWLNPVAEITALARAHGVRTLVDIAQSTGVVPISLPVWAADAVAGSCVKWLCGGPGAGFLWVNPASLKTFQPEDIGWFSHENPFEFDLKNFRYAPDARRFWGGTPSILPYAIASAGIETLTRIGVEKIRIHNQRLVQRLLDAAQGQGLRAATPMNPQQRGGTAVIVFPDPPATAARLQAANIRCDFRPGFGVRFSPHIYNTEQEIETVIGALANCHDE